MSQVCFRWGLYSAPVSDPEDLVVLVALGDHASQDGEVNIHPSVIAKRPGMEPGDVNDSIRRLRAAGLVHMGKHGRIGRLNTAMKRAGAA